MSKEGVLIKSIVSSNEKNLLVRFYLLFPYSVFRAIASNKSMGGGGGKRKFQLNMAVKSKST